MTFSKSVSKRPNLCRNDSSIFGQKHVSVSKWHCVEIVCVEVTGTPMAWHQSYEHIIYFIVLVAWASEYVSIQGYVRKRLLQQ